MRLLISRSVPGLVRDIGEYAYTHHCGMLVTPRTWHSPALAIEIGAVWAADNDCFQGLNKAAFVTMLKRLTSFSECKFIAAPDVVANAEATLTRFKLWSPIIRWYGFPVALVAQDGLESLPIAWSSFDALFIGGSTQWKLSQHAALLAREAKQRGKWVHMGRVNSNKRIRYARTIGCDSIDGTGYARFSKSEVPPALLALKYQQTALWEGLCF